MLRKTLSLSVGLSLFPLTSPSLALDKKIVESEDQRGGLEAEASSFNHSDAASEDVAMRINQSNGFALELYNQLKDKSADKNILISPLSIQAAFSLLLPATIEGSEQEIATALKFTLPQSYHHQAMKEYLTYIQSLSASNPALTLSMANNLWVQQGFAVKSSFLETIKSYYNADLNALNFSAQPEFSRQTINSFVSSKTNDLIKDLLPRGTIDGNTAAVLTNAVYMLAKWVSPFAPNRTYEKAFTTFSGQRKPVKMMSKIGTFAYFKGGNYQALSLPYQGGLSMMVILPDQTAALAGIEQSLTSGEWLKILNSSQPTRVALELPKFKMTSQFALNPALEHMGLKQIFIPSSKNFANLFEKETEQFIAGVHHKTFMRVDENGTEAAAATGISIGNTSLPIEPKTKFIVNRPALLAVYDNKYSSIIFLGRLSDPSL